MIFLWLGSNLLLAQVTRTGCRVIVTVGDKSTGFFVGATSHGTSATHFGLDGTGLVTIYWLALSFLQKITVID